MTFKDHFSRQAKDYVRYRPRYPKELFAYLSSLCPEHHTAWDCATGNGQAALGLTRHFELVIATDASAAQIANAFDHPQIDYRVVPAEACGIADHCVDLITVAQGLHWLDFAGFYREVRRVLKPGGVIAAWAYARFHISPEIDQIIDRYYGETVGAFWPPERQHIESGYQNTPFPFPEIVPPGFTIVHQWTLSDLLGYLNTWSATWRYFDATGTHPLPALADDLQPLWSDPNERKQVQWSIFMRVGRV